MVRSQNRQMQWGGVAGFTLTEILIYMAIMSLLMTGVGALVMNMKRSQVTVQNLTKDFGDRDLAIRAVQVKLGKSDQIETASIVPGDRACLRLRERTTYSQAGAWFNGISNYVKSASPIPISGNAARSISLWAWPDAGQSHYVGLVHWGSNGLSRNKFSVGVSQGFLLLDFGCELWRSTAPVVQTDQWNHIVISYDGSGVTTANSLRLFVNAVPVTINPLAASPACSGGATVTTSLSPIWVGTASEETGTLFRGGIHNLRIWDTALSPSDVSALYAASGQGAAQLGLVPKLHWALTHDNLTGQVVDTTVGGNNAAIFPPVIRLPSHKSAQDHYANTGFCFYDDDNDGLHELWYGPTDAALPTAGGAANWRLIGKDIFVPGATGFFNKPAQSAHSVTANFAVGTNPTNQNTITQKTETVNLTTQANNTVGRRCNIGLMTNLRALNCRFETAFVAIANGFEAGNDWLDIAGLIGTTGYTTSQSTTIPANTLTGVINTQIIVQWFQDVGIMRISSPNAQFSDHEWRAVLENVELRTRSDNYTAEKTIRVSLGRLARFDRGIAHMYGFNETSLPSMQNTYSVAMAMIDVVTPSLCGITPYMATITSQQEQDHMFTALWVQGQTPLPGWLGAVESPDGHWQWDAGPEATHFFWRHVGAGAPVTADGVLVTDTALFTIFGEDHLPSEAGNEWRKAVTPRQLGQPFRHTNFAFGTPSSNCFNNSALCEPHILPGYQHNLSLQTTVSGGDLWHSTHDLSAFCNGSDGQICGAYVEFGGLVSDPENVNLAVDIPVNVALQRDLCGVEP